MSELPSGEVTFLFTDIEGSTQLVTQLRERYAEALARHQSLLREAVGEHGGHEVDTQGDSFFVAFASARDAILAALEAQRALAEQEWPDGARLRVRMGVHTGPAAPGDGRYTGLAVHRAARICAAAHGGQVLVSQATESLVQDDEAELGIRLRDLGEHRLKDLERPVRVYQLEAPGLERDFREIRTVKPAGRRRVVLGSVGALVAAGGIAGGLLAARSGDHPAPAATPNSVAVIDASANSVESVTPVGQTPTSIAVGAGAVWVLNSDEQTVSRLNLKTGAKLRTDPAPAGATDLAVGADALWVATNHGAVVELDPSTGIRRKTITLHSSSVAASVPVAGRLAADSASVWASAPGVVSRLAPAPQRRSFLPFCCGGLTLGRGSVWATDEKGVVELDPTMGRRIRHVDLSFFGTGLAAGAGFVWVPNGRGDKLWRVNPATGTADDAISVGNNPAGVAVGEGSVWVASPSGTVLRIDPGSDRVVKTIAVGGTPNGIAVGAGKVWVTSD
jgi:class 3 adenylate cyclase/outer membrane protein assembly factor BamB